MSIEKVVIIIPTYNEATVIEETLCEIFQTIKDILKKDIHVLVFDSASTDDTQQIVANIQAKNTKLHLITEQKKSGLGAAYMQAMRYALSVLSADIVMEFDADLSHQPKYIAPMLEKMVTHDVVMGSRYVPGGRIPEQWGWHRKLLSVLGNYLARLVLTFKYKDFTSGFRATRGESLEKVLPKKFLSTQYAYKLQLLWLLHKNSSRIYEYPIEFIDRQKGISKLPTNSILDSLRVVLSLRLYELKSYFKMCLVGFSGMLLQCLIFNVLRQSLSPLHAIQFAVMVAVANNYTLNNRFTFKSGLSISRNQKIKSFGLFIGYSILMMSLQSYWLHLGLKYVGSGLLKENIIIIVGMVMGSFLSYFTYSRLIWSRKKLQVTI